MPEVTEDGGYPTPYRTPAPLPLAVLFSDLGDWINQAACRDVADKTVFDAVDPDGRAAHLPAVLAARQREAATACAGCPVRSECLADAVENGSTGVWGGVLITGAHGQARRAHYNLLPLLAAGELDRPVGMGRPRAAKAA